MSGGGRVPEESEERRFRLRVAEEYGERDGTAAEPADPRAAAVMDALDRTRADLAAAPTPPLPPHVLARIDRALAAERTGTTTAAGSTTRRAGRRRVAAALVAAAAVLAVLGAVVVTTASPGSPAPPPIAGPPPAGAPAVHRADPVAALRVGLGGGEAGVPADRAGCLAANGVPAGAAPLGVRRVDADGTPGVLFVLPTGVAGRFRLLVVGEGCAAGVPSTVSDGLVGR